VTFPGSTATRIVDNQQFVDLAFSQQARATTGKPAEPQAPGRRDPSCRFGHDTCRGRDGEPIRPGAACWHTARWETLR